MKTSLHSLFLIPFLLLTLGRDLAAQQTGKDRIVDTYLGIIDATGDEPAIHPSRYMGGTEIRPRSMVVLSAVGLGKSELREALRTEANKDGAKTPAPYSCHYFVSRSGRIFRFLNEEQTASVSDDNRLRQLSLECITILFDLGPDDGETPPADPWHLPGDYAQRKWDQRTRMMNSGANLVAYLCGKYDIPMEFRSPYARTAVAAPGNNEAGNRTRDPQANLTVAEIVNSVLGIGNLLLGVNFDELSYGRPGALALGGVFPLSAFNMLRESSAVPRYYYGPDGLPIGGMPAGAFPELKFMDRVRGYWIALHWGWGMGGSRIGLTIDAFCGLKLPKPVYVRDPQAPVQVSYNVEASGEATGRVWLLGGEYEVAKFDGLARVNLKNHTYDVHGFFTIGSGSLSHRWAVIPPRSGYFGRELDEEGNAQAGWKSELAAGQSLPFDKRVPLFSPWKYTIPVGPFTISLAVEAGVTAYAGWSYQLNVAAALTTNVWNGAPLDRPWANLSLETLLEGNAGQAVYVRVSGGIGLWIVSVGIEVTGDFLNTEIRAGPRLVFRMFDETTQIIRPFKISARAVMVQRPIRVTISVYVELDLWIFTKRWSVTLCEISAPENLWDLNRDRSTTWNEVSIDEEADRIVVVKPARLVRPESGRHYIHPQVVPGFEWEGSSHNCNTDPALPENRRYPLALKWENSFFVSKPDVLGEMKIVYEKPLSSSAPLGPLGPSGTLPNDFLTLANSKDTELSWGIRSRLTYQERVDGGGLETDVRSVTSSGRFVHAPPDTVLKDLTDWATETNQIGLSFPDYDPGKTYQIKRVGTDGTVEYFTVQGTGSGTVQWTDSNLQNDQVYTYFVRTQEEVTVTVYDEYGNPSEKTLTVNGLWTRAQQMATHPTKPLALQAFFAASGSNRDLAHLYWQAGKRYGAWHEMKGGGDSKISLSRARMDAAIVSDFHGNFWSILGGKPSLANNYGTTWADTPADAGGYYLPFHTSREYDDYSGSLCAPESDPCIVATWQIKSDGHTFAQSAFLAGRGGGGGKPALMFCRELDKTNYYSYPSLLWTRSAIGTSIYPMVFGGQTGVGLLHPYNYAGVFPLRLPAAALFVGGRNADNETAPRPLIVVRYDYAAGREVAVTSTRTLSLQNAPIVAFYNDGTDFPSWNPGSHALIFGGSSRTAGVDTPTRSIVGVHVADCTAATAEELDAEIVLPPMSLDRTGHTATGYSTETPVEDLPLCWKNRIQKIAVIGGSPVDPRIEIFDLATKSWKYGPPLLQNRKNHTTALLEDGRILIAGGVALPGGFAPDGTILSWCEIYDPYADPVQGGTIHFVDPLDFKVTRHTMSVAGGSGRILLAGGTDGESLLDAVRLYAPTRFQISRETTPPTGTGESKEDYAKVFGMSYADNLQALPDGTLVAYRIRTHGIYGAMGFPSEPVRIVKGLRGPTKLEAVETSIQANSYHFRATVEPHSIPSSLGSVEYVLERIQASTDGVSLFGADVQLTLEGAFMQPGSGSLLTVVDPARTIVVTDLPEGSIFSFRLWARLAMGGKTYYSAPTNLVTVSTRPARPGHVFQARDLNLTWAEVRWQDQSANETGYVIENAETGLPLSETGAIAPDGEVKPRVMIRDLTAGVALSIRVRTYKNVETGQPGAVEVTDSSGTKVWRLYSEPVTATPIELPPSSAFAVSDWESISGKDRESWRIVGVIGNVGTDVPAAAVLPRALFRSSGFFGYTGGSYQPASRLQPGLGYWVKTLPGHMWQAEGTEPEGDVTVSLASAGWKLLANPHKGESIWRNSNAPGMVGRPFVFRSGGYDVLSEGMTLRSFEGFWIKLSAPGTVTFPRALKR